MMLTSHGKYRSARLGLAAEKELTRFASERQRRWRSRGARRIVADEVGQLCRGQHQKCDAVGALGARAGDQKRSQAHDLLVRGGDWADQVVTAGRDMAETEPWVACDQALEDLGAPRYLGCTGE